MSDTTDHERERERERDMYMQTSNRRADDDACPSILEMSI